MNIMFISGCIIAFVFFTLFSQSVWAEDMSFTNPIIQQRADPWVYRHTDQRVAG